HLRVLFEPLVEGRGADAHLLRHLGVGQPRRHIGEPFQSLFCQPFRIFGPRHDQHLPARVLSLNLQSISLTPSVTVNFQARKKSAPPAGERSTTARKIVVSLYPASRAKRNIPSSPPPSSQACRDRPGARQH